MEGDAPPGPPGHLLHPIGVFRSSSSERYQAPHQPHVELSEKGRIEIHPQTHAHQALDDLQGVSHLWVIFGFHRTEGHWKPKVKTPGAERKIGVWATRSPHRPNGLGLSVVPLLEVKGLNLLVGHHDILDGSPVYDIKPYLENVDALEGTTVAWREHHHEPKSLAFEKRALEQLQWLKERSVDLMSLSETTLKLYPEPRHEKRTQLLRQEGEVLHCRLAVKTWRVDYRLDSEMVEVMEVSSGHHRDVLMGEREEDWSDLPLHREFINRFGPSLA